MYKETMELHQFKIWSMILKEMIDFIILPCLSGMPERIGQVLMEGSMNLAEVFLCSPGP